MLEKYAKWISRLKWPIVVLWFGFAAGALLFLPNLGVVVSHTSTNYLPAQSQTMQGQKLLNQVNPKQHAESTGVIVLHNPSGLTAQDQQYFQRTLSEINAHRTKYGIRYLDDIYNTSHKLSSAYVSHDNTTEIASVGFLHNEMSSATAAAITHLKAIFNRPPTNAKVFLTGQAPIEQDNIQISQAGVKKTAVVAISLVFLILLLVFRSIVTPFMALSSILVSYLMTSGIVALFAERGLPVSSFTQMFLIAILFGAGTDYSIIMINRYQEEMLRSKGAVEAALTSALKAVSKTVVFSALTVLVSFAVLGLAKFGLYRSAVGVSIGIAITLLTSLIFLPASLSILGHSAFWPRRITTGGTHRRSRIWMATSRVAVGRSWLTLLALLVMLIPVAMLFTNQRSFNPLDDIPSAPSADGFHVAAQAFGPGSVLPSQIVLKSPNNLRTPQGLTTIENMSKAMAGVAVVKEVQSATQPGGLQLSAFDLSSQNQTAAQGLQQVEKGLAGLDLQLSAKGKSGSANSQALAQGLEQITLGLTQLSGGLGLLSGAISGVQTGMTQLGNGLGQTADSTGQISSAMAESSDATNKLSQASDNLAGAIAAWATIHPDTQGSPQWTEIESLSQSMQSGLQKESKASEQLVQNFGKIEPGFSRLQQSVGGLRQGMSQLLGHANQLESAAESLVNANQKATTGVSSSIAAGGAATAQMTQGFNHLTKGLNQVTSYLSASTSAQQTGDPGFYVPQGALTNPNIQHAMNAYISPDGHVAKFTIIFNVNPYSVAALNHVNSITAAANVALASSPIHAGTVYATGTTPTQSALNRVSTQDFTRTVMIVLLAIFILLVLLLRSIITPLYMIASLAGTYFVTAGLVQVITIHVLDKPGISWTVPFFMFLLLIALGVDYSIFLMSRFEEELGYGMSPQEAIQTAMGSMGGVVFSAALIMAVTFGSMLVTGVSSLMELALAIMVGLLLYVVIFLGLFVPACASVFGRAHFWPFGEKARSNAVPMG